MNIVAALSDPSLLGALPAFRDLGTWRSWLVFLKAVYGLPLGAAELDLFRKHTGRKAPRAGGYPEAVAIVGRQAGKSQITAAVAAFDAATADARGQHTLLVAQDMRGAQRTLLNYCREVFRRVPVFARELERETADTLELGNGVSLSVYPCRPASVRGIRARLVVVDELAHFTSTDGRPTDREMLRAVRPCLAMTEGKLLILSSPYAQNGALWDLHRQHYGREDSATLVWQASAPEMNPALPADYLERMRDEDPEAYRSEVLGEFRAGVSSLFDPEAIEACITRGVRETPPGFGPFYRAFVDPSGGRSDSFALAIGHRIAERIHVDVLRSWPPPFNPSGVVEEAVALLKTYRVGHVHGDRYAGDWPAEAFRRLGIAYLVAEKAKADLYLDLLPVVNASTVEIPDVPEVHRQLRGLQRRRGPSGRDRVDHAPGSHDDLANALAGLVALLPRPEGRLDPEREPPRTLQELRARQWQEEWDRLLNPAEGRCPDRYRAGW